MSSLDTQQKAEEARAKRRQTKRRPKMRMSGKGMKRKLSRGTDLH
ncbi:MAG: hypothetical protein AAB431_00915 [Patescibacteria group bacterium]